MAALHARKQAEALQAAAALAARERELAEAREAAGAAAAAHAADEAAELQARLAKQRTEHEGIMAASLHAHDAEVWCSPPFCALLTDASVSVQPQKGEVMRNTCAGQQVCPQPSWPLSVW